MHIGCPNGLGQFTLEDYPIYFGTDIHKQPMLQSNDNAW